MATISDMDGTVSVSGKKGRGGKGLAWSNAELLALAKGAHLASTSSIMGAGMKTADLARAVRKEFLVDNTRPDDVCTGGRRGGVLDERRWDGRSADSRLKQWNRMRK